MQKPNTRICFILNPAANRHRSVKNVARLRIEAAKLWQQFEIVIAKKHDSLAQLAHQKAKQFDVIVACGGDGTISQVINGIALSDCVLGVLPIGSGNDFVKSLGIKKSLSCSLQVLHENHTTEIDLIRYEGDANGWCANTIGLGIDGWANYYAYQAEWIKGRASYYYGALKAIFSYRGSKTEMKTADKCFDNTFLMVTACNGKWEGGSFLVAPDADLQDGQLDILTIKKLPVILLITYLLRFRRGPAKWMKGVEKFRTDSLEIKSSNPVAVHRDGEHLGNEIRELKLTLERNALTVIVPKTY